MAVSSFIVLAQETRSGSITKPVDTGVFSTLMSLFKDGRKNEPYIITDIINSKDSRVLVGNYRAINDDGIDTKRITAAIFLSSVTNDYSSTYSIGLYLHRVDAGLEVVKDSPLLLKLKDGSVLDLKSMHDARDNYGKAHYIDGLNVKYRTYDLLIQYRIPESDIEKLKVGIEKMRLEVSSDICDFYLKTDNISSFLYEEYGQIKMALNKKRSFYDGYIDNPSNVIKAGNETLVDGIKCLVVSFQPSGIVITTEQKLTPIQIRLMISQLNINNKACQIYLAGSNDKSYSGTTDNGYLIDYTTNEFIKLSDLK